MLLEVGVLSSESRNNSDLSGPLYMNTRDDEGSDSTRGELHWYDDHLASPASQGISPVSSDPSRQSLQPTSPEEILEFATSPDGEYYTAWMEERNNTSKVVPESPGSPYIGHSDELPGDTIRLEDILTQADPWNAVGNLMGFSPVNGDEDKVETFYQRSDAKRRGLGWVSPLWSPTPSVLVSPHRLSPHPADGHDPVDIETEECDSDLDELLGPIDLPSPQQPNTQGPWLLAAGPSLIRTLSAVSDPPSIISRAADFVLPNDGPTDEQMDPLRLYSPQLLSPDRFDLDIEALFADVAAVPRKSQSDQLPTFALRASALPADALHGPCLFSGNDDWEGTCKKGMKDILIQVKYVA